MKKVRSKPKNLHPENGLNVNLLMLIIIRVLEEVKSSHKFRSYFWC